MAKRMTVASHDDRVRMLSGLCSDTTGNPFTRIAERRYATPDEFDREYAPWLESHAEWR
jgi:hypothetical protein